MFRFCLIFLFLIVGCTAQPSPIVATEIPTTTALQTATQVATFTPQPKPTATPTEVPTMIPTITPTAYADGGLNCKEGVALMYHSIVPGSEITSGFGLTTDIGSFEKVLEYLVENEYYFPTPEEFASDIKTKVCRHKYAIITIDDSWNDPEAMGVVQALINHGGGTGVDGAPKVWFGVITRKIGYYKNGAGDWVDPWEHLVSLRLKGLVFVVSHSQTHAAELVDKVNFFGSANDQVYALIASEVGPSRKDIIQLMDSEPLFFIYPGGNVSRAVVDALISNGYSGAFTVSPRGLDGAYAYYLPRINGGSRCSDSLGDNSSCVIEQIKLLQIN